VDLARPHRLISHPLDGSVLAALSRTTRPLTGREVARLAPEGSQPGVSKALARLADEGLVDRQEAGNAILYTLNREHLAAPAATMLVQLRDAVVERLREELMSWSVQPVHASIFGSAARGDGDSDSDVDLLVVRPADTADDDQRWRAQLDRLRHSIIRWTGNPASISEIPEAEVDRLRSERPPVIDAVSRDTPPPRSPSWPVSRPPTPHAARRSVAARAATITSRRQRW
jgi:predicted nucleotidyltransferase